MAQGLESARENVRVWRREFARFTPADLRRAGRLMDAYSPSARILLQWVPHGFGYRAMNLPFCVWLSRRREPLDLMIHEPGLGFGEGGVLHHAVAAVHRAMAAVLLLRAERVFVATQAWERRLRPYALGRKVPFEWLPVPSNIPVLASNVPQTHAVGYFGQYDTGTIARLLPILDALPGDALPGNALLIGRGSEKVNHPRAIALGELSPPELSCAIASCQVMFHLYPDGASGRRGTLMASLAHGKPVVTNQGPHTEAILVPPAVEAAAVLPTLLRLFSSEPERQRAALYSRHLYDSRFSLKHTIEALLSCESR